MKNRVFTTRFIAGVGILTAVEIVLYLAGAFITIGGVSINLALVPIAFGAIMYGPFCGAFLGVVNGLAVLLTPSTQAFLDVSPIATVFVCLLKCSLAGLASGFIFKAFKKKEVIGTIIASIIVPIINTSLFIVACLLFFSGTFKDLILLLISTSFLIELGSTAALTPAIIRVLKIIKIKENNTEENVEEEGRDFADEEK